MVVYIFSDQQLGGLGRPRKKQKVDELIVSCIFLLRDRRIKHLLAVPAALLALTL
jgi:hypothetical protein